MIKTAINLTTQTTTCEIKAYLGRRRRWLVRDYSKMAVASFPLAVAGLLAASLYPVSPVHGNWGLLAVVIVCLTILFLYWGFEAGPATSREIAVIAVLGAIAVWGEFSLAAVPSVQPVTFLVIIAGYVFGARTGFMVGATAALASNFSWPGPVDTLADVCLGLGRVSAGYFGKLFPTARKGPMVVFHFAWGYLFGCIMNIWTWTAFISPLSWQSFLVTCAVSFWFDTMHGVGNVLFYLFFGTGAINILQRIKRKLEISRLPAQHLDEADNRHCPEMIEN